MYVKRGASVQSGWVPGEVTRAKQQGGQLLCRAHTVFGIGKIHSGNFRHAQVCHRQALEPHRRGASASHTCSAVAWHSTTGSAAGAAAVTQDLRSLPRATLAPSPTCN